MNLCVNARDAMLQGGKLQIEAANVMIDENYARMQPEAKAGPYVVITIADTGIGMAPAILSKIFETLLYHQRCRQRHWPRVIDRPGH